MVNITSTPLNFDCQKGEAVFYKQMYAVISNLSEFEKLVNENRSFLKHTAELKDDRLYALVADLLAENAIDNYLAQIMPKYKQALADKKEFTFSLKIAVARELRLSPAKFFKGADIIRRIRNEFAHNLEIKTFEHLKPEYSDKIDAVLNSYFPEQCQLPNRPLRERFSSLVVDTLIGLTFTTREVHMLNSFMREDAFFDSLKSYCLNKEE